MMRLSNPPFPFPLTISTKTTTFSTELIHYLFSDWAGVSLDEFPNVAAWLAKLKAREAVQRGFDIPTPQNKKPLSEEELEKIAAQTRSWVQSGMAEDAKKA